MTELVTPPETRERLPALQASLSSLHDELLTPALVIDLDAVEHNIAAIVHEVGGRSRWRPHIKTIKQGTLVRTLMQAGMRTIKCATVDELALAFDAAERVDPDGRCEVLLAYPPSRNIVRAIADLMHNYEGATVQVLADSPDHLSAMASWACEAGLPRKLGVLLDVDVGMHRTGRAAQVWAAAKGDLVTDENLAVVGVHGYEGHVQWDDEEEAFAGYDALVDLLQALPAKHARWVLTSGSHAFRHALSHAGLQRGKWRHQVTPGTLVLSDLRSAPAAEALGLRQAVFVVSRAVSRPTDERVTLDAGTKALAPDCGTQACTVVGHPELQALPPSEEHRSFRVGAGAGPAVDDLVWLVPAHACTTVNMHRSVLFIRGGRLQRRQSVDAMSRSTYVSDRRP